MKTIPPADDMLPRRILQADAAARRYRAKKPATQKTDTPARKKTRFDLLPARDPLGRERILGESDLLPISFLRRGVERSRSICRVNIFSPEGRPEGYGTGFLVAPGLLLTNNHVLPDAEHTTHSFAEFGFEQDLHYRPTPSQCFAFDANRFFATSVDLDYTLITVRPESFSGTSLTDYGFIPLIERSGKALKGESVSIVQHPSGMHKMLTVRGGVVEDPSNGAFVHYDSDTLPGSSGAPVFNDQWEVVALHHMGVPKRNTKGQILLTNGKVYVAGTPDSEIAWVANEGVRISEIFTALRAEKRDWSQAELEILVSLATDPRGSAALDFAGRLAAARRSVTVAPPIGPTAAQATKPLTVPELLDLAGNPETTEAELAPYFVELAPMPDRLDPQFVVNERLVTVDPTRPEESVGVIGLANWICKKLRHQAYARRLAEARQPGATQPIRIVAEGDSWFQYPFRLDDVIDHLMSHKDYAVLCFSEAGDVLRQMAARGEFYPALERENPSFFLISGGGNDMVEGRGLRDLLEPYSAQRKPAGYRGPAWKAFCARMADLYGKVFQRVLTLNPNVRIVCHGYDYPIPNNGPWLGRPMADIGITDPNLQHDIVKLLVDDINTMISTVAGNAGNRVRYVDCRNVVAAGGWHDEFHPDNANYGKVAQKLLNEIANW